MRPTAPPLSAYSVASAQLASVAVLSRTPSANRINAVEDVAGLGLLHTLRVNDFLVFIGVGFLAQLVDGALGMAYGVVSNTVLLSIGVHPATASASVHAAEVFTSGVSGLSHWRLGNISKPLMWRLVVPGMVGGGIGAYLLAHFAAPIIRPIVSLYLGLAGAWILFRAFRHRGEPRPMPRGVPVLGFVGAFLDAIGGGGWGPIVTSTLIGTGAAPRFAIGSVNAAEFFVTLTVSLTFLITSGFTLWPIVAGLLVGGVIAAPIGARLTRKLPEKPLMIMVGLLIVGLSIRGLVLWGMS
ncbi:MAG: sulfite exporter TauE/SafE family protein [Clostridia bacterium]|nr:sulfite exporter TauE/SafE family protein [Deltaproteobacteria bacterium]